MNHDVWWLRYKATDSQIEGIFMQRDRLFAEKRMTLTT